MSIKSAQAKQQLRNSDGTFANENKKAGLPSNDMIQRASKLLAKSSATVDEPIIKPSVKSEGYMGSTAITGGKYDARKRNMLRPSRCLDACVPPSTWKNRMKTI